MGSPSPTGIGPSGKEASLQNKNLAYCQERNMEINHL
jgi:hypothetical protein